MDTLQSLKQIISVQDIRTRLADITNEVEAGQSFVVFRHSKPVFRIVPLDYDSKRVKEVVSKVLDEIPDVPPHEREVSDEEIVDLVREVRREQKEAALLT